MVCKRCYEQVTKNKIELCRRFRNKTLLMYIVGINNNDSDKNATKYKDYRC